MKKSLLIFLCLIGLVPVWSQQDPQFTGHYYNQLFFNPATAGTRGCISASLQGRFQWVGLSGAPISWSFGLDVPFKFGKTQQNCIGFGVMGYGDYIGYSNGHGMRFSLNYQRKLGPGFLSLGMDFGFQTLAIVNATWIPPGDTNDPGLPPSNARDDGYDMGIGLYYSTDYFYVGFSALHLTATYFPAINSRQARHLYFNTGGFIPLGASKKWQLHPNAIIRSDLATANFDFGLNAIHYFNERNGLTFGATYRYIDAVGLNVGYALRSKKPKGGSFLIGYHFDLHTSRLASFGSTSHEITLRYCFPSLANKLNRIFY